MLRLALLLILIFGAPTTMARDGDGKIDRREQVSEEDQAALEEFMRDLRAMNEGRMSFRQLITKERPMSSGKRQGIHDSPEIPEFRMPR